MLADKLTTRAVYFAYLFGPPRTVRGEEATALCNAVREKLRIQDFQLQYDGGRGESHSQSFSIKLSRKEGRGSFSVTVDNPDVRRPMRLLMEYVWPQTLEHVRDQFDRTSEAVFQSLACREGAWQRVKAESRIRAHVCLTRINAVDFVTSRLLRVDRGWLGSLGNPVPLVSCRFESVSSDPPTDPLDNPTRELSIEVLREDRSCMYFELVTHWFQIARKPSGALDMERLRRFEVQPSKYVDSEHTFLLERVKAMEKLEQ